MSGEGPDAARMTPLAKLLRESMDQGGWDLKDVTRPPDGRRPGGPARSTMSWHLQPERWLKTNLRPATVKELATAVRVSEDRVAEAAAISQERFRDVPVDLDDFSARIQRKITELAELMPVEQSRLRSLVAELQQAALEMHETETRLDDARSTANKTADASQEVVGRTPDGYDLTARHGVDDRPPPVDDEGR